MMEAKKAPKVVAGCCWNTVLEGSTKVTNKEESYDNNEFYKNNFRIVKFGLILQHT